MIIRMSFTGNLLSSPENNKSGSGKNTYINVHHQHIKPHERLTFLASQNRSRTLAGLQREKKPLS